MDIVTYALAKKMTGDLRIEQNMANTALEARMEARLQTELRRLIGGNGDLTFEELDTIREIIEAIGADPDFYSKFTIHEAQFKIHEQEYKNFVNNTYADHVADYTYFKNTTYANHIVDYNAHKAEFNTYKEAQKKLYDGLKADYDSKLTNIEGRLSSLETEISKKANSTDVSSTYATKSQLSNYATTSALNNLITRVNNLESKVNGLSSVSEVSSDYKAISDSPTQIKTPNVWKTLSFSRVNKALNDPQGLKYKINGIQSNNTVVINLILNTTEEITLQPGKVEFTSKDIVTNDNTLSTLMLTSTNLFSPLLDRTDGTTLDSFTELNLPSLFNKTISISWKAPITIPANHSVVATFTIPIPYWG